MSRRAAGVPRHRASWLEVLRPSVGEDVAMLAGLIPTRVHGVIDYMMGLLLIAAPWLFGFADSAAGRWVPVLLGAGVIVYSLMTDYELGAVRAIPMTAHLWLDILGGVLLIASPWLFGFA